MGMSPLPPLRSLSRERLQVLEEAKSIGSVAETCRRVGISRQTLYLWKRRFEESGLLGLENQVRRASPGRPGKLTVEVGEILFDCIRRAPTHGAKKLAATLTDRGHPLSPPTVQKFLIQSGLATRKARIAWGKEGCPRIRAVQPIPKLRAPSASAIETAKRYFFFGIPSRPGEGAEIPSPTLEEVARSLRLSKDRLEELAVAEQWAVGREGLRAQVQRAENEERMQRILVQLDIAAISSSAYVIRQFKSMLQASPEGMTPRATVQAAKVITTAYEVLKQAFGGGFPVLTQSEPAGENVRPWAFFEYRWSWDGGSFFNG